MYYSRGPLLWVTPISAFPTPVPPTATYYTVPTYYVPPAMPFAPFAYYPPVGYAAPMVCEPAYYPAPQVSLPRGEYHLGQCLVIC